MSTPFYRHKSLTPHASVNDLTIPEELRDSLLETTTLLIGPDAEDPGSYGASRAASPGGPNTPGTGGHPRTYSSYSVPMFNGQGKASAAIRGVSQLQFQRLTWYFTLVSFSWPKLFLLSFGLYLTVLLLFSVAYYVMCTVCGADVTPIGALYFVVVSISANGGYMGEDIGVLYPGHRCFAHRTYLVMLASYLSILLGAMIAAVFVSKAATHGKLQHRIVFSDYITLNRVTEQQQATDHDSPPPPFHAKEDAHHAKTTGAATPPPAVSYQLTFRVASISDKPMVHGKLRLYLISRVPWGKFGAVTTDKRTGTANHRSGSTTRQGVGKTTSPSTPPPPPRARRGTVDPAGGGAAAQEEGEDRQHLGVPGSATLKHDTKKGRGSTATTADVTFSIPQTPVVASPTTTYPPPRGGNDNERTSLLRAANAGSSQEPPSTTSTRNLRDDDDEEDRSSSRSGGADSLDAMEDDAFRNYGTLPKPTFGQRMQEEDACSVDRASAVSQVSSGSSVAGAIPLSVRVTALAWRCDEEIPLNGDDDREDLLLWFPVTIRHTVAPYSPLHCLIAARMSEGNLASADEATRWAANMGRLFTPNMFQVVAVYEGTDAETSTTVEAKHVYTPDRILAQHHFAAPTLAFQRQVTTSWSVASMTDRLTSCFRWCCTGQSNNNNRGLEDGVGVREEHSEIFLDYYKFNELEQDDD